MDAKHKSFVSEIQSQIQAHYAAKIPFRIYHGSTNSTRVLTFKRSELVDVSALSRVLSVDADKRRERRQRRRAPGT